jgi:hypothetical protein
MDNAKHNAKLAMELLTELHRAIDEFVYNIDIEKVPLNVDSEIVVSDLINMLINSIHDFHRIQKILLEKEAQE